MSRFSVHSVCFLHTDQMRQWLGCFGLEGSDPQATVSEGMGAAEGNFNFVLI